MFIEYNITSVYASNLIGIMLLIIMFISNFWRFRYKTYENKMLIYMMLVAMAACFMIVVTYYVDGKEGNLYRFLGYLSNTLIYIFNMVTALLWVFFVETHLRYEPSTKKKLILSIPTIIGFLILIINIFTPVVFRLDNTNTYIRYFGYYILLGIDFIYIINAAVLWILLKARGVVIKFFPIYLFAIPIAIGLLLEAFIYGLAIAWPCIAISIACVLASLQNELIYRDNLTGVYNRSYLNYLQKNIFDKNRYRMTGIMLDMNDFKAINDEFGHAVGDKALLNMASILKEAVSDMGTVIRYAGDEFIVLINSQNEAIIETIIEEINNHLDKFNKTNDLSYKLSASMGYSAYNPKEQSIDDFMNIIDQKMYEAKKKYHNID